jgi:YidC/Oxa1 family membrane protein insertase
VDRRFLLFLILSFLVLMANASWNVHKMRQQQAAQLAAGGPAAAEPAEPGEVAKDGKDADGAKDEGEEPAAPVDEKPADAAAVPPAAGDAAAAAPAAEQEPATPLEYVTLGSVDPASSYRMLVTLTNEGAGVRRVELSSPRYLDLHDRSGYLGQLELAADGKTGLLVRALGAGTPAAEAGLEVGDRIVAAGTKETKPVSSLAEFAGLLATARPRSTFSLDVVKSGGERKTLSAKLRRRPLEVIRPESENVRLRGDELPPDFVELPSFLLTFQQVDDQSIAAGAKELAGVDLAKAAWRIVEKTADSVTFERRVPDRGLTVTKRYRLAQQQDPGNADPDERAYHLTLELTIANDAEGEGPARRVAYRLAGPNGLPMEGWWYAMKVGRQWGAAGIRDVLGRYFNSEPQQRTATAIAQGKVDPFEGGSLAYMGVDAQYFAAALIPNKESPDDVWLDSARTELVGPAPGRDHSRYANVSFDLLSQVVALKPGEKLSHSYTVFAGPKRPGLLAKYVAAEDPAYTLGDFVYYGWFSGVSRFMVGLLHVFYGVVRNYGIAILMLTVLIRGCMFPVSRGQAKSMAKMTQLKPEMERIKEKFKGDQQKQAQAMQQLYRKHNVNPLAGCLPALIQLPVFVGLWRGLAVDIELRQAPLFGQTVRWCSNLAGPDMFWDWSGVMPSAITRGEGFFGLGPYLNLLPLVTVGMFLWQQKMFMPEPANEQAAMQQKIMKYMMVLMGIMFYKVPSGLCLYSIASSLWGIGERKLFPPPTATALDASGSDAPLAKKTLAWVADEKKAAKNGQAGAGRSGKAKRKK